MNALTYSILGVLREPASRRTCTCLTFCSYSPASPTVKTTHTSAHGIRRLRRSVHEPLPTTSLATGQCLGGHVRRELFALVQRWESDRSGSWRVFVRVHCMRLYSGNHFCWREHHDWVRVHGVLAVTPWLRYVTNRLICKEPAMPRYSFKLTLVVSLCVFNTEISADRLCSELRQQELW